MKTKRLCGCLVGVGLVWATCATAIRAGASSGALDSPDVEGVSGTLAPATRAPAAPVAEEPTVAEEAGELDIHAQEDLNDAELEVAEMEPISTAFTLHGQRLDIGNPPSGLFDFACKLFDAAEGGAEVGEEYVVEDVEVVDGRFQLDLDFGDVFDGKAYWVELAARPAGVGEFTALPIREVVAPTSAFAVCPSPTALDAADCTPANAVFVDNAGRVGIGTTTPETILHVVGNEVLLQRHSSSSAPMFSGRRSRGTAGSPTAVTTDTVLTQLAGIGWDGAAWKTQADMRFHAAEPWTATNNGSFMTFRTTSNGGSSALERMRIKHDGNVGIGMTNPDTKLAVNGDIALPWGGKIKTTTTSHTGRTILEIGWDGNAGDFVKLYAPGQGAPNLIPQLLLSERRGVLVDPGDKNAGDLGADSLGLRFGGPTTGEGIASKRTAGGNRYGLDFYTAFANRMSISQGGNVGIGTSPDAKFDIKLGDKRLQFRDATFSDPAPTLNLTGSGGAVGILRVRNKIEMWPNDARTTAGSIDVRDATGAVRITADGGTGRIRTPVLEITGGGDLAERFDIVAGEGEAQPGMVLCIDPLNPGRLAISRKAYERTVAGVMSGAGGVNPGMLMSQNGSVADGQYPVALTGRVYVLADASNSAIEPGDLLTTSDTPGHAMKASDYARAQGAVLGKAMTALPGGNGLVLVLVSLQ